MDVSEVTEARRETSVRDWRIWLAFFAIYVLWGTTFLAVRIVVLEVPPLFAAALRFLIAGLALYSFMRVRGECNPTLQEWRNLAFIALCMFVLTYGPIFWAEKYISSGVTSIIEATMPITTIVLEVAVFRSQPARWQPLLGVALGFAGVTLLMLHNTGQQLSLLPCLAVLAAGFTWSYGAVLSGRLALPRSRPLIAGAEMLLGGVILLCLSAFLGELRPFPHVPLRAGLALLYLIVFGSLIAFTAFVWLLSRMPATRVASHAYVNPVVAVALGYFAADEVVTLRTLLASILVIAAVFLILTDSADKGPAASELDSHSTS